ncbi:MAG: HIT family protein [Actinomycetota bacterium]
MERLFRPWRAAYVTGPKDEGCFLCEAFSAGDDRAYLVVARGVAAATVLNKYPYNNGHLMVAPLRHLDDMGELSIEERAEVMDLVVRSIDALRASMDPDGFNVGANLGRVAGAGLPGHLHLHVVPRWGGDTNFMPVIGDTKVLPESLEETYERLRERFGS